MYVVVDKETENILSRMSVVSGERENECMYWTHTGALGSIFYKNIHNAEELKTMLEELIEKYGIKKKLIIKEVEREDFIDGEKTINGINIIQHLEIGTGRVLREEEMEHFLPR